MSDLKSELDNERARDIHSCGPHCQRMECQQRREIERLSALVALQRKDMKQAMDDNQRLEDAMRQIQATTSDKAVQSITDEALCFITEQEGE